MPKATQRAASLQRIYERYGLLAFLLVGLAILPVGYHLSQLRSDNAIESWLSKSDPAGRTYAEFTKEFGANEQLLIAIECESKDPRLETIATKLEKHPAVLRCLTPERVLQTAIAFGAIDPRVTGRMPTKLEEALPDAYLLSLVGQSGKLSVITAEIHTEAETDRKAFLKNVRELITDTGFEDSQIHFGGPTAVNVALDKGAEQSMKQLMPLVGLIAFAFLIGSLRDWRLILMMIFCGVMTVAVTLAAMTAAGTPLDLIGISLPPMLLVLSLSFGLHLIHHWRAAPHAETAVGHAVTTTFRPTALAAGTTAIGCASLSLSQFQPVAAFGIWSAFGVCVAFVLTYVWAPAYLIGPRSDSSAIQGKGMAVAERFVLGLPAYFVCFLGIVIAVVAAMGVARLTCETDALKFLPADSTLAKDYALIEEEITGLLNIDMIVHTPRILSLAQRIETVRAIADAVASHARIPQVVSWVDLLPADPDHAAVVLTTLLNSPGTQKDFETLLSDDTLQWRLTACVDSADSDHLANIVTELSDLIGDDVPVTSTGIVTLILAAQEEIFGSLSRSLLTATAILFLVLTFALGSPYAAAIVVVLNVTPVLTAFGVLGWLGHPINMATLTTASIALGVALDDTMHFIEYFRSEAKRNPTASRRVLAAITAKHCFLPMAQTTLIAGLGLVVLTLSTFVPIAEFGGLLAALLACALIGDLVLLPAALISPLGRFFQVP